MDESEQQRIFDQWLREHRGLFFKVVRSYAFNPHDQDDLFQEIAKKVWNSIPKFRGDSKPSTWIYRVALYAAIAWSKKEKKHRDHYKAINEREHVLEKVAEPIDERLDWLYDQLARFDEIDRSLVLMFLDGYSYSEISTTVGISESNVGVKLNRIKKQLSESLKEESHYGIR